MTATHLYRTSAKLQRVAYRLHIARISSSESQGRCSSAVTMRSTHGTTLCQSSPEAASRRHASGRLLSGHNRKRARSSSLGVALLRLVAFLALMTSSRAPCHRVHCTNLFSLSSVFRPGLAERKTVLVPRSVFSVCVGV